MYVRMLLLMLAFSSVNALDNGVGRTPPMGWLQWERFRCIIDCKTYPDDCISEKLFMTMANHLHDDGYLKAGYNYINIDDCWSEHARDKDGNLVADRKRFPSGIANLANYVHSRGLKMGIYTDFGTHTCGGYPGSIFYMQKDTEIFAKWGIDSIKVDGCYSSNNLMPEGYAAFGWHMNQTNREMLYSCSWPAYLAKDKPYKMIAYHCNIWRNYADIQDNWDSVMGIVNYQGDHQDEMIPYVAPGAFNDPDMLIIGNFALSEDESKTQMALWSIMAAPLLMSNDLRKIVQWQKDILLNEEVIAVDQDVLGKMGRRVRKDSRSQLWARELVDKQYAVAMVSTRNDIAVYMSFTFKEVGLSGSYHVRDLYLHQDMGVFNSSFKALVNPHGVVLVKLSHA